MKASSSLILNLNCFADTLLRVSISLSEIFLRASSSRACVAHTSPRALMKGAPNLSASFSRDLSLINTMYLSLAYKAPTVSLARAFGTFTSWPFWLTYLSLRAHLPFITRSQSLVAREVWHSLKFSKTITSAFELSAEYKSCKNSFSSVAPG